MEKYIREHRSELRVIICRHPQIRSIYQTINRSKVLFAPPVSTNDHQQDAVQGHPFHLQPPAWSHVLPPHFQLQEPVCLIIFSNGFRIKVYHTNTFPLPATRSSSVQISPALIRLMGTTATSTTARNITHASAASCISWIARQHSTLKSRSSSAPTRPM
jgi:hypothetical protein